MKLSVKTLLHFKNLILFMLSFPKFSVGNLNIKRSSISLGGSGWNFGDDRTQILYSKLILILFVFLLFSCEEKKPVFYPELTSASTPQEGILPYFKTENMDPYWIENETYPSDLRKVSNISLLSDKNEEVNDRKLLGKYKLVLFFYAKCSGICPMITRNMVNFLPRIENQSDIEIVSFTINPDVDTVDVLKKFKEQYKVTQTNWIFVTGSKKMIYDMARTQFGADVKSVKGNDDLTDFVHTENVYLLDKKNYLRGMYRARGTGDLERLLVELKTLREIDKGKTSKL